jgi:hypothetical protein
LLSARCAKGQSKSGLLGVAIELAASWEGNAIGMSSHLIAMWIADFLFQTPQSEPTYNSRAKEKSLVG